MKRVFRHSEEFVDDRAAATDRQTDRHTQFTATNGMFVGTFLSKYTK
jgi:hypothetical protein